jgi:hypothetical protein
MPEPRTELTHLPHAAEGPRIVGLAKSRQHAAHGGPAAAVASIPPMSWCTTTCRRATKESAQTCSQGRGPGRDGESVITDVMSGCDRRSWRRGPTILMWVGVGCGPTVPSRV